MILFLPLLWRYAIADARLWMIHLVSFSEKCPFLSRISLSAPSSQSSITRYIFWYYIFKKRKRANYIVGDLKNVIHYIYSKNMITILIFNLFIQKYLLSIMYKILCRIVEEQGSIRHSLYPQRAHSIVIITISCDKY